MEKNFSHLDSKDHPQMVDVGQKDESVRFAKARSIVQLPLEVAQLFQDKEIQTKKGPVFQTAILAGIMAVKKTSELIPLCHPLPITKCNVEINMQDDNHVVIDCIVKMKGRTGVEMEALTGASIAALTIYDMCKGFSHDIVIEQVQLMEKTGGKRDFKR